MSNAEKVLQLAGPRHPRRREKVVPIDKDAPAKSAGRHKPRQLNGLSRQMAEEIAAAPSVAILSDFDGTLAPIRRRPEYVKMSVRVRDALAQLARQGNLVGIVSGRGLIDVRDKVGLHNICYVGCHGYTMQDSRGHTISLMNRTEKEILSRARRSVAPQLRRIKGIRLEPKEAGLAVHYRDAGKPSIRAARSLIDQILAKDRRLHLLSGKKVWEILPGPRVDKWTAIRFLLALENHADSLLVYIGDDVTDESVFSRMRGISIAVGKPRNTAAQFVVDSPFEVWRFLDQIIEAKENRTPSPLR
jgi:trehalose 6-phosphate phosphatase